MPAPRDTREKRIHQLFEIGILLKGADGLVEIVLGALLMFVNVADIVRALVQHELIEDPGDYIANHLVAAANATTADHVYVSLYLLIHGIIKVALVVGLLRGKLWAYPASLAVLGLFVAYQVVAWLTSHSVLLALLTLFDLLVIWLIWHEYRLVRAHFQRM